MSEETGPEGKKPKPELGSLDRRAHCLPALFPGFPHSNKIDNGCFGGHIVIRGLLQPNCIRQLRVNERGWATESPSIIMRITDDIAKVH